MKSHTIAGAGGISLHCLEAGNPAGRPIVFLHGFSQCGLVWSAQLDSELARDHRLVAPDLRGHGLSDKPVDGYGDSRLWADDVHAVITTLDLRQPILCGWSYGSLVTLDYLRHYGDAGIGGLHLVGAITRLGSARARALVGPAFLDLAPGFVSTDAEESVRAMEGLVLLAHEGEVPLTERYLMLGWNVTVPPRVRAALFARSVENDDVLANLTKPVLITHGTEDAVVKVEVTEEHRQALPRAEVHVMEGVGHAPFRERPEEFNRRLREFSASLR